jgi:hypothetical protein
VTAQAVAYGGKISGGLYNSAANATAEASAVAGHEAMANAISSGNAGTAMAMSGTAGGILNGVTATANAPSLGSGQAQTEVEEGTALSAPTYGADVVSLVGGLAQFVTLGSKVGMVFLSSSTTDFGTAALGVGAVTGSTTTQTYSSAVSFDVNTATLHNGADLYLGLVSDADQGAGFSSLTFSLSENGKTILTQSFTSVTAANTYFTDDLKNLGAWTSGSNGALNLTASLAETVSAGMESGNGYGINLTLGVH